MKGAEVYFLAPVKGAAPGEGSGGLFFSSGEGSSSGERRGDLFIFFSSGEGSEDLFIYFFSSGEGSRDLFYFCSGEGSGDLIFSIFLICDDFLIKVFNN